MLHVMHVLMLPWLICIPVELFEGCDFEKDPKSLQDFFIFDMLSYLGTSRCI